MKENTRIAGAAALLAALAVPWPGSARADTYTVTNLNDSGASSLRQAITSAAPGFPSTDAQGIVAEVGEKPAGNPARNVQAEETTIGDVVLTVGGGPTYIKPQVFAGADSLFGTAAQEGHGLDEPFRGKLNGEHLFLEAETETSLEFGELDDVRLAFRANYSHGQGRQSGEIFRPQDHYLLVLSVDPQWNFVGVVGNRNAAFIGSSISMEMDNTDMSLGLDARGKSKHWEGGTTLTPMLHAGLFASHQRYAVETKHWEVDNPTLYYARLDESLDTWDFGPKLGAGLELDLPGGASVSVRGDAAIVGTWAALSADQEGRWLPGVSATYRPPSGSAHKDLNTNFTSLLFQFALNAEAPLTASLSLGVATSYRRWSARPTIMNPLEVTANPATTPNINSGVKIGRAEAWEANAALALRYTF